MYYYFLCPKTHLLFHECLISQLRLHCAQELHGACAPGAPARAQLHDAEGAVARLVPQHGLVDGHVFALGRK